MFFKYNVVKPAVEGGFSLLKLSTSGLYAKIR